MDGRRLAVALLAAFVLGAGSALILATLRAPSPRPVEPIELRGDTDESRAEAEPRRGGDRKKQEQRRSGSAPVPPASRDDGGAASVPAPSPLRDDDDDDEED